MKCRAMTKIMHVFLCVVVVVSAFFYAPMEVEAETFDTDFVIYSDNLENVVDLASIGSSYTGNSISGFYRQYYFKDEVFDFASYMNQGGGLYKISFDISFTMTVSNSAYFYNPSVVMSFTDTDSFSQIMNNYSGSRVSSYTYSGSRTLYTTLDDTTMDVLYTGIAVWTTANGNPGSVTIGGNYSLNNISVEKVSVTDSEDYQNGYNAGYAEGETAGYSNGYSNGFADGEASVDTDAIYDEAFQAGKDSVDTQSYYDAGYQAGYDVAYSSGYESGYDVGYQEAMDRIANWGADTSDYPVLMQTISKQDISIGFNVSGVVPHIVSDFGLIDSLNFSINANHTYKFNVYASGLYYDCWQADYSDCSPYLVIGSSRFLLYPDTVDFYVPGFNMSSDLILEAVFYGSVMDENVGAGYVGTGCRSFTVSIYDMGPSGDTQNHIANQTDQLTNGYDSSQGAAMNEDFKASVNDYQTAEDSLFTSAQTSLDNFTFLDFTSITGMVTALSFVSSIMTRIYNAMGGDTGAAGIILSVLFSIMLVSMAIGLYRFYVSNGKSDNSNKGGD